MDSRTLAYINLYAVLGSIGQLVKIVPEAGQLVRKKNISVGFAVAGGPSATLKFKSGDVSMTQGTDDCDIKLPFRSPDKFNGMVNGDVTPVPSRGFGKIGFLLKDFTKLTKLLERYLRPSEEDMKSVVFANRSTELMLHVIAEAAAQVANEDEVGRASASYIVDGTAKIAVKEGPSVGLKARGHTLRALHEPPEEFISYMEFCSMELAGDLFNGRVNAVACIGAGKIRIGGMISQIDNINRLLDRVALYLA